MIDTKYYPKAWFRVDYRTGEDSEVYLYFEAFKIESLDEDWPEASILEKEPCLKGWIKWDGCCEFDYAEHYCGLHAAEQFLEVIRNIYAYADEHFGESSIIEMYSYLFKRNDV